MPVSDGDFKEIIYNIIDKIRDFINSYEMDYLWVPVSGGKDSVAVWSLVDRTTKNYNIVFIHIPGQTHTDNVNTILSLARKLSVKNILTIKLTETRRIREKLSNAVESCSRPCLLHLIPYTPRGEDYWQAMIRYGFPAPLGRFGRGTRWCCGVFKHRVLQRLPYNGRMNGVEWKYGVNGVKATDSPYRSRKYKSDIQTWAKTRDTYLFPLRNLRDPQVWGILEYMNLKPIVELQYLKWGRSPNCMFCPMLGKRKIEESVNAMPESLLKKITETLESLKPRYRKGTYSARMINIWLENINSRVEIARKTSISVEA